eukprot:3455250-Prymnesium_polylepis.1
MKSSTHPGTYAAALSGTATTRCESTYGLQREVAPTSHLCRQLVVTASLRVSSDHQHAPKRRHEVEQSRSKHDVVAGNRPWHHCSPARQIVHTRVAVEDCGSGAEIVPRRHEVQLYDKTEELIYRTGEP